ncbi:MAG: DUF4445 domain-containing protein [Magnetococcales bacterium]|nr:DUF4445 domain-containing protein [Magnetococcales bacterium]
MTDTRDRVVIRVGGKSWHLTPTPGESVRAWLDTTPLRVRAACGGTGGCGACVIRLVSGASNPLTRAEREKLTPEQLRQGYRLACQARPVGSCLLELEDPAPPSPWQSIPADELRPIQPPDSRPDPCPFRVAVDLGTTHLRLSLWNRRRRLASRRGLNPQLIHGADILNRLHEASRDPVRAEELADLARRAILEALTDMLARDLGETTPMLDKIGRLRIVGNTAMLTLLAGVGAATLLDPDGWDQPLPCQPGDPECWRAGWGLPNARITLVPPVAGFIGSDLLACLLASRLTEQPPGALLLDLGTNIEMALWDGRFLHVASTPGGPAFEMTGIRHGVPSDAAGAVTHVDEGDGGLRFSTIGQITPQGYCGTGLIDAVALLCRRNLIKPSGRFAMPVAETGFPLDPDQPATAITSRDIDQFQRSKAACAAAIETLLQRAGRAWHQTTGLWLCGAFGAGLNIENAQFLGLLPPLKADRIHKVAGAALAGCETALLAPEAVDPFSTIRATIEPVSLATDEGFSDTFFRHLRLTTSPGIPIE